MGATFFGYTLEHMLYRMTFAQLLTLIQTRNERERRAYEEAERQAALKDQGYESPPPMKDLNNPDNLPSVSEVMRALGGLA